KRRSTRAHAASLGFAQSFARPLRRARPSTTATEQPICVFALDSARGAVPVRAIVSQQPMLDIAEIFSPDGALAARLPGFSFRAPQQEMATVVAQALASGKHAAIEAGTGIGKTFAYLVPVLVSGRRAIVSTGTRTLQDQLFARDLPLLGALLGRPARV